MYTDRSEDTGYTLKQQCPSTDQDRPAKAEATDFWESKAYSRNRGLNIKSRAIIVDLNFLMESSDLFPLLMLNVLQRMSFNTINH